jgi:glycerol uptake facilitator protein
MVGFAVLAVGLSLGGPSGYAINPARDLAPRVFAALSGSQGVFDPGFYWLVAPVIGPFIGGLVGVFTYDWFVTAAIEKKQAGQAQAETAAVRAEAA